MSKTSKKAISAQKHIAAHSKKDTIVAVRMPKGLVDELKDIQKINHFMDISDEIRFVLRKYCITGIVKPDNESILLENKRKEKLIEELNNIIMQLRQTSGGNT